MDPTIQRSQRPLKAALNFLVFVAATYLAPACSTLLLLCVLARFGCHFLDAAIWGGIYYWALAFEAVTAYRRQIALPQAIDLSLDPPVSHYVALLLYRCLIGLSLPALLRGLPLGTEHAAIAVVGVVAVWGYVIVRETIIAQRYGRPHLEAGSLGNRIKPVRVMRQVLSKHARQESLTIPWGGVELSIAEVLKNVFLIGSVGTGKTLIIKAFLARLLPHVYQYPGWRAVVVDPKGDLGDTVMALLPRYKIQLLNFGSAETLVWHMARDVATGQCTIHQIVHGMIEAQQESQPFFTEAARAILQAIMMALSTLAPGTWWFSDIFFVARSFKRTELLLGLHQSTREILDTYAANQRVLYDVFATMSARLADFYPIAAVCSHVQREHPERTFSIANFVSGNSVVLIQMQASASASQGRLFALLLKILSKSLLDEATGQSTLDPEHSRRTFITIDEVPRAGKIDLINLVTNGRDYGIGLLLATQSIDAMLPDYPQDKLNALMNEFHTMGFLSANSPTTLKWMADRLGNTDSRLPYSEKPQSLDTPGDWTATLDPTQFHTLRHDKTIGPNCIPGIFLNSQLGAWYSEGGVDLPESPASSAAHAPIPRHWKELRPWDDEDLKRLNLLHLKGELELASDARKTTSRSVRTRPPSSSRTNIPRFRP